VVTEKALTELPESLKAVIVLKDVLGFDYQDIAKILGCPVGMLISRLWKGRNLLKKSLKDYCAGSVRPPVRRDSV
jgi:RNA polymerase sigma-70 factor (ECF subfamily)